MQAPSVNLKDQSLVYMWLTGLARRLHPTLCPLCGDSRGLGAGALAHDECLAFLPLQAQACHMCALPLQASSKYRLCGDCAKASPHFDRAYTPFRYQRPISDWVQALKFEHRLSAATLLAAFLSQYLIAQGAQQPQILIPVPLHTPRLRRRGYNQAHEIGRRVGRDLGIPSRPGLLRRTRSTQEQSGLSAAGRRKNVRGAFAVVGQDLPQHITLIDDVITTASTVNECARVLKKAGVARVDVWAVARAVKD